MRSFSSRFIAAALVAVACFAATARAASAPAALPAPVVLQGHGVGHGIGLSQWGAEARAEAGEQFAQILSFYYPHTGLSRVATNEPVRVLVTEASTFKAGAWGSFTVRDARGKVTTLAGMQTASLDSFGAAHLAFPLELSPVSHLIRVGGLPYAGSVRIVRRGHALLAINVVPVESYVTGVVSCENPAYWRLAALEAQAVAARSYVLAHRRPKALFDVYSDDRSQNYRGLARNFPSARRAAAATAGTVLVFHGRIANAMFSASNGGLTSAGPAPYLVTQVDPFDARSPVADWGPLTVSSERLATAFPELRAPVASLAFGYDPSERVTHVTFTLVGGGRKSVSGFTFQQRLGLRSTYFSAAS